MGKTPSLTVHEVLLADWLKGACSLSSVWTGKQGWWDRSVRSSRMRRGGGATGAHLSRDIPVFWVLWVMGCGEYNVRADPQAHPPAAGAAHTGTRPSLARSSSVPRLDYGNLDLDLSVQALKPRI